MWHRIVNGVWKWSGMRAWHRKVSRQLRAPGGGHVGPSRDHADSIPVFLSPGSMDEQTAQAFKAGVLRQINERGEA